MHALVATREKGSGAVKQNRLLTPLSDLTRLYAAGTDSRADEMLGFVVIYSNVLWPSVCRKSVE
jgi:hypothetical protein